MKNLVVEVNAKYIKGIINNSDIQPNAIINYWISAILLFDFRLHHVPGHAHSPDGLSRRPSTPEDPRDNDDYEDWIDTTNSFIINLFLTSFYSNKGNHNVPHLPATQPFSVIAPATEPTQALPLPFSATVVVYPTTSSPLATMIPWSNKAKAKDDKLKRVAKFLVDPTQREGMNTKELKVLIRKAFGFFVVDGWLWKKDPRMRHKLVVEEEKRLGILRQVHDKLGHKGIFTTHTRILERFWWPYFGDNVRWYLKTYHECQVQSTQHLYIPPTIPTPLSLFCKVYIDTMLMPRSNGFCYTVHDHCSLFSYPEWHMLRHENSRTLESFVFEDILCRWGAVEEIVTDNGPAFVQAVEYLSKQYHINHICILPYNSHANGPIERRHFNVQESLIKAGNGKESLWTMVAPFVFWAERVSIQKSTGYSPYFLAHGTKPLFPFDLFEATYLAPVPTEPISPTDLIAYHTRQLQKRPEDLAEAKWRLLKACWESVHHFKEAHKNRIKNFNFEKGTLVLVRNLCHDDDIGGKTRPWYFGPMVVVRCMTGDSYILAEIDRTMSKLRFAAFRLIPYHAHDCRSVPLTCLISEDIDKFIGEIHEPGNCADIWHTILGPNHPLLLPSSCN